MAPPAPALLLGFLLLAGAAQAQDFRGAISGRITDASGAVLPGVTVTVTHRDTNVPTSTTCPPCSTSRACTSPASPRPPTSSPRSMPG